MLPVNGHVPSTGHQSARVMDLVPSLDLSLFIPRYKVRAIKNELGGKILAVHMRRKYVKLPLFMVSFYLSCYTAFMKSGINPEECFVRMHYDKNYYSYLNGKLRKNVMQRAALEPYLSWHKQVDMYKGHRASYYSVTARFTDPNSEMNFGFTARAWSTNVTLYITKEMIARIGNPVEFDWAGFFTTFLEKQLQYHKAVYIMACKNHVVHRLHALQKEMKEMITSGEFY